MIIKDHKLLALIDRKNTANRMWDHIFKETLNGNIDIESIGRAMSMCNKSEQALMDHERLEKEVSRSIQDFAD